MTTHQLATSSTYQVTTSKHQLPERGQAKPLITMRSLCCTGLPHAVYKDYWTTPQNITQCNNACLLTPLTLHFSTGYVFWDNRVLAFVNPCTPNMITDIQGSQKVWQHCCLFPLKVKLCVHNVYFLRGRDSTLCYLKAEHHPQREQLGFLNATADGVCIQSKKKKRCLLEMTRLTHISKCFAVADMISITELTV